MAQADFDFFSFGSLPIGGTDGVPITHVSLSNPLTFHGAYGREYRMLPSGSGATGKCWVGRINAATSSGAFVGTPLTKAVSLRAWVRVKPSVVPGAAVTLSVIGVSGRTPASVTSGGYHLVLGRATSWDGAGGGSAAAVGLRLCKRTPAGAVNGSFPDTVISGTFVEDIWYAIRLDIVPVGSAKDRLDVYTGVADGFGVVTWTLVHTVDVLVTDPVYNQPTGTTRCGFTAWASNTNGSSDTSNPASSYIDAFEALVVDAQ